MAQLVTDCPRCNSRQTTFDVRAANLLPEDRLRNRYPLEAYSICRHCRQGTIIVAVAPTGDVARGLVQSSFLGTGSSLNDHAKIDGYISLKDRGAAPPPEHLPKDIESVFSEGARCLSVGCFNAAGTMFRLCVDLATKQRLPSGEGEGLNARTRRDLGLRLPWLFAHGLLPIELKELSTSIKEDGNDGAHAGTLTREDAQDILDFTEALLERLYTEPARLRIAAERRAARRAPRAA
jgi:hypothetical protein